MESNARTHRIRLSVMLVAGVAAALAAGLLGLLAASKPAEAAFPGKNGKIAFASFRSGNGDIYAITSTRAGLGNLTQGSSARDDDAFSPDGKRMAYARAVNNSRDVYIKNLPTGQVTRTTKSTAVDADPTWSPDGKRIAFISNRTGGACGSYDLYIMKAAPEGSTNRPARRTNTCGDEGNPEWSPKGNLIAYDLGAVTWDVYVMRPDGSNKRPITESTFSNSHYDPTWSPDDTEIAFDNFYDVFKIRAGQNGGNNCVRCANLTRRTDSSLNLDPSWSPDGKQIAFVSTRNGNSEIYVMRASDSGGKTNVTRNSADDKDPYWITKP